MQSDFRHITEEIRRQVEDTLTGIGILSRVFARGKNSASLTKKMQREPQKYKLGGKMIQDTIGIRVALYFSDDIPIVKNILQLKYLLDLPSSTIDSPESDEFSVTRYNLIFRLPECEVHNFQRIVNNAPIDATFEVQLRSILSEGWHEVEHDLRYKVKEYWKGHDDLSRTLNGVIATLETSEWSMGRIFDELAHRHYRDRNWAGMLPNLLRMRLTGVISRELISALNSDTVAAKDLFRIDRAKLIKCLFQSRPYVPLTMENLVFFWNATGPRHPSLLSLTPNLILDSATSVSDLL